MVAAEENCCSWTIQCTYVVCRLITAVAANSTASSTRRRRTQLPGLSAAELAEVVRTWRRGQSQ